MDDSPAARLWKRHLIAAEVGRQFVDCKLLDDVMGPGKEIVNKSADMEKIVEEMVAGTDVQAKDLIRKIPVRGQRKPSVCIAARTMQLILLRGLKKMPWNEARRSLVEHFFPQDVLPYVDPYKPREPVTTRQPEVDDALEPPPESSSAPRPAVQALDGPATQPRVCGPSGPRTGDIILHALSGSGDRNRHPRLTHQIAQWKTDDGCPKFWQLVFTFARQQGIKIDGLIQYVKKNARRHHRVSDKNNPNLTKILLHRLLTARGTTTAFCEELSLVMRTGNTEDLIGCIRAHLDVRGLKENLVPSIRSIRKTTASIVRNFIALCRPERTFSGFRVDLVTCVKIATFLIHETTSLDGIRVDIWGDGCEIGGKEVTRLTFRLLRDGAGPSAQSSDAVFCFATYRGKDARYALELNIGPTKVGSQESGWLFMQASFNSNVNIFYTNV